MNKQLEENLRLGFLKLSAQGFEAACCQLLKQSTPEFEHVVSNLNELGRTKKGIPDAHVMEPSGTYIAIQMTTQKSGVKEKILRDIADLDSDKCHFREKISKVVICVTSNIASEVEIFNQSCIERGWKFQILPLDRLVSMASQQPDFCLSYLHVGVPKPNPEVEFERFYCCGDRLKVLREEREISPSQFIDLVDHYSEKSLLRIESGEDEASLTLIKNVSNVTGAGVDWIRHGIDTKYASIKLPYYDSEESVQIVRSEKPKDLFMCIDVDELDLILVARCDEYRWQVYNFDYQLDFWRWYGDTHFIPQIFRQLKELWKMSRKDGIWIRGLFYNSKNMRFLHDENHFTGNVLDKAEHGGMYWFEDLFDINHSYPISSNYESSYGTWFTKVQASFRHGFLEEKLE